MMTLFLPHGFEFVFIKNTEDGAMYALVASHQENTGSVTTWLRCVTEDGTERLTSLRRVVTVAISKPQPM